MSLQKYIFEIFREETSKEIFPAEVNRLIPTLKSLKRTLYRMRTSVLPPLPRSVAEIRIYGQWSQTVDGRNFLLCDSGTGNDRIIVSTHFFLLFFFPLFFFPLAFLLTKIRIKKQFIFHK